MKNSHDISHRALDLSMYTILATPRLRVKACIAHKSSLGIIRAAADVIENERAVRFSYMHAYTGAKPGMYVYIY